MSMVAASDITAMNLAEYKRKVIMIGDYDAGDWVYSAKLEDVTNTIPSGVIKKIFGKL